MFALYDRKQDMNHRWLMVIYTIVRYYIECVSDFLADFISFFSLLEKGGRHTTGM